jgi:hypothetical protein
MPRNFLGAQSLPVTDRTTVSITISDPSSFGIQNLCGLLHLKYLVSLAKGSSLP